MANMTLPLLIDSPMISTLTNPVDQLSMVNIILTNKWTCSSSWQWSFSVKTFPSTFGRNIIIHFRAKHHHTLVGVHDQFNLIGGRAHVNLPLKCTNHEDKKWNYSLCGKIHSIKGDSLTLSTDRHASKVKLSSIPCSLSYFEPWSHVHWCNVSNNHLRFEFDLSRIQWLLCVDSRLLLVHCR